MKNLTRYNQQRKQKFLKMLDEMSKRVKSGQLVVSESGFWTSGLDNSLNFKFKLISRDSDKEIKKFSEFS